jgi:SH3-like domain-containing protein
MQVSFTLPTPALDVRSGPAQVHAFAYTSTGATVALFRRGASTRRIRHRHGGSIGWSEVGAGSARRSLTVMLETAALLHLCKVSG